VSDDAAAQKQAIAEQKQQFWGSFLRATESTPNDVSEVRGASGITHPVAAVGVDDARRRIVVISREAHAKAAALAQVDIQAANPDYRVVLARPVHLTFHVLLLSWQGSSEPIQLAPPISSGSPRTNRTQNQSWLQLFAAVVRVPFAGPGLPPLALRRFTCQIGRHVKARGG